MPKASANVLGTDKELKAASAPRGGRRDFRIKGAPDLQLRVTPGKNDERRKSWCVVYKRVLTGKWTKFVFGTYPAMKLEQAKNAAKKLSVKIKEEGFDPALEKKRVAALGTFRELAADYMREQETRNARNGIRSRSTDEAQRLLDRDILPTLGDMRAELVKRKNVADVVARVAKRGALVAADRVLGLIRAIYTWAVDAGQIDFDPTLGLKRRNAGRVGKRVLSEPEIKVVWHALDVLPGISSSIRDVLRLQLLTGLRVNEVCEASRGEIDFDRKLWVVPEFRTKGAREHVLPLSDLAIEILRGVTAREDAHAERRAARYKVEAVRPALLFPSHKTANPRRRAGKPLKQTRRVPAALDPHAPCRALVRARSELLKLGVAKFSSHDLRRSLATHCGDLDVPDEIVGKILNHAAKSVTGQVYNHSKYLGPMRIALDAWAEKVRAIITADEAVAA